MGGHAAGTGDFTYTPLAGDTLCQTYGDDLDNAKYFVDGCAGTNMHACAATDRRPGTSRGRADPPQP